jgi:hypothetical protein
MNGNRILADTNILLYFLKGEPTIVDFLSEKEIFISFINELEPLSFPTLETNDSQLIHSLLGFCNIIPYNPSIRDLTISIRKSKNLKLPDSIVLASAIYLEIPLVTADKGFLKTKERNLIWFDLNP